MEMSSAFMQMPKKRSRKMRNNKNEQKIHYVNTTTNTEPKDSVEKKNDKQQPCISKQII